MAEVFDCSEAARLLEGTRLARQALGRGELVVLPTDTVYGIAADAFSATAVQRLLDAKGRGRQSPPPVLIPNTGTLAALAADASEPLRDLASVFWPGPLTVIVQANPALDWDLGETGGTVALRIPGNELARELLQETGPLAVSSANRTGEPPAGSAAEALEALGESVSIYLDGGEARGTSSTIIDATKLAGDGSGTVRILRTGGVTMQELQEVLPNATIVEGAAEGASEDTAEELPEDVGPGVAEAGTQGTPAGVEDTDAAAAAESETDAAGE